MSINTINNTNFKGNVFITTNISKKAKKAQNFLASLLNEKYNGKSFKNVIKNMPFDAYISCKNPTKKAINPVLTVFLEKKETKKQVGLYSITNLKCNKPQEIERMHQVLSDFAKACEENKNKPPLTRKENILTIEKFIYKTIYNTKYF